MCGIIAFIGKINGIEYILNGIKMLENRGYDSCGFCSIVDNKFEIVKYASRKDVSAIKLVEQQKKKYKNSKAIMAHTRWATHGKKNNINSHPHTCNKNKFSIIHNGIIENYAILKKELEQEHGIHFYSETDTEIIVNLISIYYVNNVETAIKTAMLRLKGSWSLIIMCVDTPDTIYCCKNKCPLLIGKSNNYVMMVSEQSGFCNYVDEYICLNNGDLISIKDDLIAKDYDKYKIRSVINDKISITPYPYMFWTIKEIYEQIKIPFKLMYKNIDFDKHFDNLIILACGTSYNAGLHCLDLFKQIDFINTVQIFDGSEFTKHDIPKIGKTCVIMISQSGETKDLYNCLDDCKEVFKIGIINVVDSLIARHMDYVVYTESGKEMAVASTKVFTSQVIVLHLVALYLSNNTLKMSDDLFTLPQDINEVIVNNITKCKSIAKYLFDKNSLFILGKGNNVAIAKEGALKIKEIGYINAGGYSSSSLKHGTYSLLEKGTPVIMIIPNDKHYNKNNSVAIEVKSRQVFLIGVSDIELEMKNYDICIKIPSNETFNGLLCTIVFQLIAYELSILKGINPDFPRNLCKSVTTD